MSLPALNLNKLILKNVNLFILDLLSKRSTSTDKINNKKVSLNTSKCNYSK